MIRATLGRTLLGAALALALSTVGLAPASAASAPVITWQGAIVDGASYLYGQVPAEPTCTATEDLAPVPCTVTGYETGVGVHVLTATAIASDAVTTTVETRTYTVTGWTLTGFYKPVKMNTVNRVKAGSTVPLKFKVFKGSAKATSASVVASFTAQRFDCATLVPVGAPAPVATTKGFRLKYRDGAFHQNWKTPKLPKPAKVKGKKIAPAPTCYAVTLLTQDGSSLTANFRLK
jgi:hypothetical protein